MVSELADTLSANQRDTLLIVPAVLVLVFLVLALLLRSLIAPLYLLAAVTLNFLAAIGACSYRAWAAHPRSSTAAGKMELVAWAQRNGARGNVRETIPCHVSNGGEAAIDTET